MCCSLSVRKNPTSRKPVALSASVGNDTELKIFFL